MKIKEELYKFCEEYVSDRTVRIKSSIADIREALASETKSSAGDKHETGRAMLQLDREKLGQQLLEVEKMGIILTRISIRLKMNTVILGSLVRTSKDDYFLAVSAGAFDNKSESVFCISAVTPMAKLLLGKSIGDVVDFNGDKIRITKIE
jgi:transcription elongation GreA/GreB family factor